MAENAGRPPKFKNVEEMQERIEKYFLECEGKLLKDGDGKVMTDKSGNPIWIGRRPPTVTGLALALGFHSRQSLLNYQSRKAFMDTVTRAKSRIEMYTEERLFDSAGANGAKFSLVNNFCGWSDKKQVEAEFSSPKLEDLLKK